MTPQFISAKALRAQVDHDISFPGERSAQAGKHVFDRHANGNEIIARHSVALLQHQQGVTGAHASAEILLQEWKK